MRLVEATRPLVLLEDPELEPVRPQGGHVLEERVTEARADRVGVDVEVREPVAVQEREAAAEEVGLALAHAAAEEGEVLLVRVQLRQEVEQRERRLEDRDDLLDVVNGRAADHRRRLRGMRKRDEPVRLTRIYTRGGDKGETSLGDGSRISKLDPRVAAIGDVDELNSLVGWAGGLERVQNELFDLGADLSVPFVKGDERLRITDETIDRLEQEIDEANASLPELKSFVLPGGSERAARLFLARAVCRRAERAVLAVPGMNPLAAVYLNRLSDLLFVLARAANAEAGVAGPLWRPGSTP